MYRPRSDILEVITPGPVISSKSQKSEQQDLHYEAPITYSSSPSKLSTAKASKKVHSDTGDHWHTFNVSGTQVHIYSAYYDDRPSSQSKTGDTKAVIRMTGAVLGVATVRLYRIVPA